MNPESTFDSIPYHEVFGKALGAKALEWFYDVLCMYL